MKLMLFRHKIEKMFRPTYPDIVKPEYSALCCIHIRTLASIIATIGLIKCALYAIGCLVIHNFYGWPFFVIFTAVYIAVIAADKFEQPVGYIPFLICHGATLILGIMNILIFAVLIFLPAHTVIDFLQRTVAPNAQREDIKIIRFYFGIVIIIFIIGELIGFYIWNIVRRARTYMIEEVVSGRVKRNAAIVGYDGIEPPTIYELRV